MDEINISFLTSMLVLALSYAISHGQPYSFTAPDGIFQKAALHQASS